MRPIRLLCLLLLWSLPNFSNAGSPANLRPYLGTYLFEDGVRVTGGRFDESGSSVLLYIDTDSSLRGAPLQPAQEGFVPAFGLGGVEHVAFENDGASMRWELPAGKVLRARRVMHPDVRDVEFTNGNVRLAGSLYLPPDAEGPLPAVVLAHGSGAVNRHAGPWITFFVEQGMAVLSYDKRGVGDSTGNWRRATFFELAADLSSAIDFMRELSVIDADRVGLHTSSQSGWYGPRVARECPGVAFLIQRAGPAVDVGIGTAHEIMEEWRAQSVQPAMIRQAGEFWLQLHRLAAEEASLETGDEFLRQAREASWFSATFGDWEAVEPDWWRRKVANMKIDPAADAGELEVPVLWFLAEDDENVPYEASRDALEKVHDAENRIQVVTVEDAPHNFLVEGEDGNPHYTTQYWPVIARWLVKAGVVRAQ